MMVAGLIDVPEFALENDEARAMAEAIAEVNRHYKVPGLNPAHAALLSMAMVMIAVYGKRAMLVVGKKKGRPAPQVVTPQTASPDIFAPQSKVGVSDWLPGDMSLQ